MTTYQWSGPNGGDWSDQDNWINDDSGQSDEGVPGAGDTAELNGAISTGDATVGTVYAYDAELTGGLTVTGDLYGGVFEGGAVSAQLFDGGRLNSGTLSAATISGGTFMSGATVSAGVVDGSDMFGGTLSAATIEDCEFYGGSTRADDLLAADVPGGAVSVSLISSSDYVAVSSGGSLSAGEMIIDHPRSNLASVAVSGGSLIVTGRSDVRGGLTYGAYVDIELGEINLEGGLVLGENSYLINGQDGSGGALDMLSLSVAEAGSATVELSGGQTSVTSSLILGDAGQGMMSVVGGATLSVGGDLEIASESAGSGSAIVSGGAATVTVNGDAEVGVSGSGSWALAAGATMVVSGGFEVGAGSGGAGAVVVSGEGTELTLGAGGLTVAGGGSGTLTVGDGGAVDDSAGDLIVGASAGAKGRVTASGAAATLEVGGDTEIGASGQGTLTLTGAAAEIGAGLTLGEASGAKGSLKLVGGALALTGDVTVGEKGQGAVSLTAGGTLGSGGSVGQVVVGEASGAKGSLSVTGAGSLLESEDLVVGDGGTGSLAVSKDAEVVTTGDAAIGETAVGQVQKATLTSGAVWSIDGALTVGAGGIGEVTVGMGAELDAEGGLVLGEDSGAAGTLTVTGTGGSGSSASASTLSWGGAMEVGAKGSGLLKISGGGLASGASLEIGAEAGAVGSVSVAASGSVLSGTTLAVGGVRSAAGGSGLLTVGAGAAAHFGSAVVWGGGEILVNGGTVRLGAVENQGLIKTAKGVVSAVGAFAGSGAVAVGSGGRFVLDAADTTTANRVRLTAVSGTFSLTGGSGADLFQMSAADLTSADVVAAGAGEDTLAFTTAGTIAAAAFKGVGGIDVLSLARGTNKLTLSEAVVASSDNDLLTIDGGTGSDTVNASAVTSGAVVFNGADTARTVFSAGAGVVSATGGSGADIFEMAAGDLTSSDVISGGAGSDTVRFTAAGTIAATAFTGVSGIDVIHLAQGSNTVALTNGLVAASDAHRLTIAGGTGSDTIDASLVSGGAVVFDGAATTETVFTAGAGVVSATGGSGNDIFRVAAGELTGSDRINGGQGDDTLQFTTAGTLTAAAFAHISGIDTIDLSSGNNSLTLSEALAARSDSGRLTVAGAAGSDRLNAAALSTSTTLVFDGNGGDDIVHGGKGDNLYDFDNVSGALAITNAYSGGTAGHGELQFGSGLTDQDLWLERKGANLLIDVLGTTEEVTISGWFGANKSAQVAEITADGLELDTGVAKLVSAMASFSAHSPGFSPTASGTTMPQNTALQNAIAAAWHS